MPEDELGKQLRHIITKELAEHTNPRLKMPPCPAPFSRTEATVWFKRGKYEGKRFAKAERVLRQIETLKASARDTFELIFLNEIELDPWRFSRFYYEQKEETFCKGFVEGYQWKIQKKKQYLR